ncbi:MAG: MlaD family protein [Nocardioides sp.]
MITRRTKVQLAIFALITMLGVSFVGARYAQLNRLFYSTSYTVVAHFKDSGGMYAGGLVSYRGVAVGQVHKLVLTSDGVDAYLDIDNGWKGKIPSDTLAVVGNRSAVGEQYVDLQPQTDSGPFLHGGSQIAMDDTRTPLPTQKLLGDLSNTVESVHRGSLRTTVHSLGQAFAGTGLDLQRIIDTGTSFIHTANQNFDVTTSLLRDGNTVLRGQVASSDAIRSFARDLKLFSGTLAGHDRDLRRVIDSGSATATELRTFLQDNRVHLASLIGNLVTTGDIVVKHLPGLRQVLVVYPYVVEGGFSVVSKSPETGLYDAHFGLVLTNDPQVCHAGLREHRHPAAAGRVQPQDEPEGPLLRARVAVRRPRRAARARQPSRRGVPHAGGVVRPRHGATDLGIARPRPTRRPGEPRPRDSSRGDLEMAVSPALDRREVTADPEASPPTEQPLTPPPPTSRKTTAPRSAAFRLVLAGVLVVGLVAALAWVAVLRSHRTGAASDVQSEREAVMSTTQQFVMRVNTYGPSMLNAQGQMPQYRASVTSVITPKFAVSFDQTVPVAERSVKSYGIQRTCAVYSTGVEVIDSDSAQVLVAGSISQSARNAKGKQVPTGEPAPFRLRVSLDRVDGTWLVDDYQPVSAR